MSETASGMRRRSGLSGFFGLSGANRWALAESLVTLALVSLAIRVLPFRTVVKAARSGRAAPRTSDAQRAAIFRCRWASGKESCAERPANRLWWCGAPQPNTAAIKMRVRLPS